MLGLCLSAADLGYQIVLPTDAIAGLPRDYAEPLVVKHSLALLARLTTTTRIIDSWAQLPGGAH